MRVLTKIEIFVHVYLLYASINATNWDCKKPQICPWFPPKTWEESGSKTKSRSKHRKGNGVQEAGQDNRGKTIRAKNNTGKTLIGGRGKSGQTEHLERLKRLSELRCSLSWLRCWLNLQLLRLGLVWYLLCWLEPDVMMAAVKVTFICRDEWMLENMVLCGAAGPLNEPL